MGRPAPEVSPQSHHDAARRPAPVTGPIGRPVKSLPSRPMRGFHLLNQSAQGLLFTRVDRPVGLDQS